MARSMKWWIWVLRRDYVGVMRISRGDGASDTKVNANLEAGSEVHGREVRWDDLSNYRRPNGSIVHNG